MNLKELKELRNVLVAGMKELVEKAELETRSLNDDENAKFTDLEKQIADVDKKIEVINQQYKKPTEVIENKIEERGKEMNFEIEKRAIGDYIRKNDTEELRSMTRGNSGALVPTHLHGHILEKLDEVAPLFARTRMFTPVNGKLDVLREDNIGAGAWVGEGQSATAGDFTVKKVTLNGHRATATIQLSQSLINDAGIDISGYTLQVLSKRMGRILNETIINGNKELEQPEGLLYAPKECEVEAKSKTAVTIDDIIDLYNSIHPEYLKGSVFVIGREEFNKLSKLKNATGEYYLQRDLIYGGTAYTLLGLPVFISDVMPKNTGAGNEKLVILANLNACYATMLTKGVELKKIDSDSTTALAGNVLMVLDCYVGGGLINNDAVRILKTPQ